MTAHTDGDLLKLADEINQGSLRIIGADERFLSSEEQVAIIKLLRHSASSTAGGSGAQEASNCDDWQDDPSADERWNAGLDFGMVQLCAVLGVDPHTVNWDAATETLDGDVCAAIGNIFRTKYGEDFDPTASPVPSASRGTPE